MVAARTRVRPQLILAAMHRLSEGRAILLDFDDIVVEAFTMFPDEFTLQKYPEYPDSANVEKSLHGSLKKQGMIRSADRRFALTQRGVEASERLVSAVGSFEGETKSRVTRFRREQIKRMLASDAFRLFREGEQNRILDTDFYAFLDCTVRSEPAKFVGSLASSREAVSSAVVLGEPDPETVALLKDLFEFLQKQFQQEIQISSKRKSRRISRVGRARTST